MAQTESIVDQGVDRVQDALKSADKEFQKVQRKVKTQRRTIERRFDSQRKSLEKQAKSFEKQAQKQIKSFEKQAQKQIKEIRKNDLVKRVETLGADVQSQLESGVESVLSILQIATKTDVQRVDRKLNRISKKLKELEASPQA